MRRGGTMKAAHVTVKTSRNFIRHPSDIPIEVQQAGGTVKVSDQLRDIGMGGLSFRSDKLFNIDDIITIRVSIVQPAFESPCRVVWCQSNGSSYEIGVEFLNHDDMFKARMVEQICHIEHYKKRVESTEGRYISCEQAASEWIDKFAADFPNLSR